MKEFSLQLLLIYGANHVRRIVLCCRPSPLPPLLSEPPPGCPSGWTTKPIRFCRNRNGRGNICVAIIIVVTTKLRNVSPRLPASSSRSTIQPTQRSSSWTTRAILEATGENEQEEEVGDGERVTKWPVDKENAVEEEEGQLFSKSVQEWGMWNADAAPHPLLQLIKAPPNRTRDEEFLRGLWQFIMFVVLFVNGPPGKKWLLGK